MFHKVDFYNPVPARILGKTTQNVYRHEYLLRSTSCRVKTALLVTILFWTPCSIEIYGTERFGIKMANKKVCAVDGKSSSSQSPIEEAMEKVVQACNAVERRLWKLRNFQFPSQTEIYALAEHICLTLFNGHMIYKKNVDVNQSFFLSDGKKQYHSCYKLMSPTDFETILEKAKDEIWGGVQEGATQPIHISQRGFYFLNNLLAGDCESFFGATPMVCCQSFLSKFDNRVDKVIALYFPEIVVTFARNDLEENCYKSTYDNDPYWEPNAAKYEIKEWFYQYLSAQDWRRFVKPVKEIVEFQDDLVNSFNYHGIQIRRAKI